MGVIGAGRVGAVLAAGLRAAGHEIVAVAGESDASRDRAAALLPGVPLLKPTDVARAADVLLLTVPDDMLDNVATMLSAAGVIRKGQVVVHTSGRHGLAVLTPAIAVGARAIAMHPAMTFTGTDVDLPRLRGCVYGVTTGPAERELAERLVGDLGGLPMFVPEDKRALYHAGLAHGANHLVTLVTQAMELLGAAGAEDPAATLRPLLNAALDNALAQGDAASPAPSSAATSAPSAATSPRSPPPPRTRCPRTSPWRAPRSTASSPTAGCCRSARTASARCSTTRWRPSTPPSPRANTSRARRCPRCSRAPARSWPICSRPIAPAAIASVSSARWARCTRGTRA